MDHPEAAPTAAEHPVADAKYVSLTTFRRSGEGVATPVWVAPLRDGSARLAVITVDETGKTKRLAHTERVEVRPCDMRGRVADGAPTYRGTGVVVRDPSAVTQVRSAVVAKYGLPARFSDLVEHVTTFFGVHRKPRAGILLVLERTPVS